MNAESIYTVNIFDMQGRIVDYFTFEGAAHQYSSNLISEGIYILEIQEFEKVIFKQKLLIL